MRNLTATSAMILQAVAHGSRYGFDIMERTGLPSGTVYPVLRRFEDAGLVESAWESDDRAAAAKRPRRKYYELTGKGRTSLDGATERYSWLAGAAASWGTTPSGSGG